MNHLLEKIFYLTGNYGPLLLIISTLALLRNKEVYFTYYAFASILNVLLNHFLKIIIQEPRPSVDKKTFDLALKHMKSKNYSNAISYDVFGMPSGHAQSVLFSTTFLFLVLNNENWKTYFFYIMMCLVTMFQRVQYQFHTISQVMVGGIIGMIFAYVVYYLATQKKKGSLKEKEEENGPL
jgi:membrane-associated phospholipid phosphatase